MGDRTKISWCDATWNPWIGCSKVSPGCLNCYMFTLEQRWGRNPMIVRRTSLQTFAAPLLWQRQVGRGELPKGHKVFTCSMSDFFIKEADPWREEAWDIMRRTPDLIYQVLTKRPGRMAWWAQTHPWPSNVWAGVSVESAKYLPRLDVLARVPAKVRFISAEPLLGPLDLRPWLDCADCGCEHSGCKSWGHDFNGLNLVIVGGESGPNHRPMKVEWVQRIADDCKAAGVACFVKKASAVRPGQQGDIPDNLWARKEFPNDNAT